MAISVLCIIAAIGETHQLSPSKSLSNDLCYALLPLKVSSFFIISRYTYMRLNYFEF